MKRFAPAKMTGVGSLAIVEFHHEVVIQSAVSLVEDIVEIPELFNTAILITLVAKMIKER